MEEETRNAVTVYPLRCYWIFNVMGRFRENMELIFEQRLRNHRTTRYAPDDSACVWLLNFPPPMPPQVLFSTRKFQNSFRAHWSPMRKYTLKTQYLVQNANSIYLDEIYNISRNRAVWDIYLFSLQSVKLRTTIANTRENWVVSSVLDTVLLRPTLIQGPPLGKAFITWGITCVIHRGDCV